MRVKFLMLKLKLKRVFIFLKLKKKKKFVHRNFFVQKKKKRNTKIKRFSYSPSPLLEFIHFGFEKLIEKEENGI